MEFLEQQAIATAPLDCQPRLWKRYVDDILEIVKSDQVDNLTPNLNQTDPTEYLVTVIVRKADGSVNLLGLS